MKEIESFGIFRKDLKRIKKRGWNRAKLDAIILALRRDAPLPENARPHILVGEWLGFWECHVAPNWLFIYDVTDTKVVLARTGSHQDLFE